MKRTVLLAAACLSAAAAPLAAQVSFGTSVTVTDGQILVGEPHHELRPGLVFVFEPDGSGGWRKSQTLSASDGTLGDRFGIRTAVDGGLLLVSATRADGGDGAVYAYRRDGSTWREQGRLPITDGMTADSLGSGLAVSGDWIMAGTIARNGGRGAVRVFRRNGNDWTAHSTLMPDGLDAEARFGSSVEVAGDWAFVSAPGAGEGAGAVHAFHYVAGSDSWTDRGVLANPVEQPQAGFGAALAARDGRVFVGIPGFLGLGGVAVFDYAENQDAFGFTTLLLPFQASPQSQFGSDLTLMDGDLFVGSPAAGPDQQGRAYVYRWDSAGEEWNDARVVGADDLSRRDGFGSAVGLGARVAAVSALGQDYGAGAVYVFERQGGEWREAGRLYGDETAVAAITGDEVRCADDGSAALFDCSEVDLLSFLPIDQMGANRGVRVNDVWGWTDPENGREIAILGMTDQTVFVDVSNAYQPTYLGRLPLTEGANPSVWRDMKVYEDHVYVVADGSGDHGMQVFDLTRLRGLDGSNPPTFDEDAHYDRIASAHNIVINEETGFAYAVGASGGGETCGGGLHMIDIRQPESPTFAGCFSDPSTGRSRTGYSHDAQCVVYHGPDEAYQGHEICLGSNETALSIADVTDKASPEAVAMATYPNVGYSHQGWLSDDHAWFYMDDELDETGGLVSNTRTLVWDLSDLDDPILVKEHFSDNQSSDHNLYIVGNTMYQSNYASGLRVLDISDPANPRNVGFFDTVPYGGDVPGFNGSWSNYPFFDSGIVVVTSGREGLFLVRYRERNLIP